MSALRARPPKRGQRGYTLVELMMALAIFMLSVLGIMAMQKVCAMSNAHARNLATAQHLAHATAAQLELEATRWKGTPQGAWLKPDDAKWQRLDYDANRKFGSAFDGFGTALTPAEVGQGLARFCSNVRVKWLFPANMGRTNNGVMRAEIRVYWVREGTDASKFCTEDDSSLAKLGASPDLYQFVYETVALRDHSQT